MSMRCPNCHKHVPSNILKCPHCGTTLPDPTLPTEVEPSNYDAPIKWRKQDTYAIIGLGLCAFTAGVFSPASIVFSILSLKGAQKNRWLSYFGLGLNIAAILAWIILLIVFFANR